MTITFFAWLFHLEKYILIPHKKRFTWRLFFKGASSTSTWQRKHGGLGPRITGECVWGTSYMPVIARLQYGYYVVGTFLRRETGTKWPVSGTIWLAWWPRSAPSQKRVHTTLRSLLRLTKQCFPTFLPTSPFPILSINKYTLIKIC